MNPITAVVLTKNEEEMIKDCLNSVSFCSEIIIIDSKSTDSTLEIAKKYHAKIFEDTSTDWSKKRNLGLKHASQDWILYIDADERVTSELKAEIITAITTEDKIAYSLKRKNFYLGKHEWPQIESFLRLFRKEKLLKWEEVLHER